MTNKKIFPSKSKILLSFTPVSILLLLVLYFSIGGKFTYFGKSSEEIKSLLIADAVAFSIWIVLNVVSIFILFKYNFYIINNNELIHHRFNKELHYQFNEIIYIDEKSTLKNRTLLFYTSKGDARYLILDKDKELLKILQTNCKNLLTKEAFQAKFPNIRL